MAILNDSGTVDTRPTVVKAFTAPLKNPPKKNTKPKAAAPKKPAVSDSWMRVTAPAKFTVTQKATPPAKVQTTSSNSGSSRTSSSSSSKSSSSSSAKVTPPKPVSTTSAPSTGGGLSWNPRSAADRAATAANTEFDPQIAAVAALMQQLQQMAERNKTQVTSMYGALSKNIMDQLPVIGQQYDQTQGNINDLYQQLQGTITGNYSNARDQQMAELQRLGIQQAAPDAFKQQDADKNFLANLAGIVNQGTQNVLDIQQKGTEDFTRSNSNLSSAEGTNRVADIMSQLADRTFTLGNQQNALIGQKASAQRQFQDQFEQQDFNNNMTLNQFNAQQEQAKREFAAQQQQQLFNNQITLAQMQQNQAQFNAQLDLQKQQFAWSKITDAASAGGGGGADTTKMDPLQKAAFTLSQYSGLGGNVSQTLMPIIQSVMQSDPAALNGFYTDPSRLDSYGNPTKVSVTPQYFADLVKKRVNSQGYSQLSDAAYQTALQLWIDMQAKRGA